jgi:probable phosphoglycerate mutase
MTIYVVRHGRTSANASGLLLGHADPGLDELGQRQAKALAQVIPAGARVLSSPLRRCRETARALGVEPEIDERLVELNYGDYDLRPLSEIPAEVWATWRADASFRPPGGETLEELAVRVGSLLEAVLAEAGAGDVVLVTHVSPVKAALAWALGVGPAVSWRSFVGLASVTRIGVTERGPSLHCFNSDDHLRHLAP